MQTDYITAYLSGFNTSDLTAVSALLDSDLIFGVLLIAVMLLGERRQEKIKKILMVLILAFVISTAAKELFKIPRPCADLLQSKIQCPKSYSFPSTHATLSFALALAFLNKRSYPAYLLFAIAVSFTRIYLFVHSLTDIAGGIVIAAISYYLVELATGEKGRDNKSGGNDEEVGREDKEDNGEIDGKKRTD